MTDFQGRKHNMAFLNKDGQSEVHRETQEQLYGNSI